MLAEPQVLHIRLGPAGAEPAALQDIEGKIAAADVLISAAGDLDLEIGGPDEKRLRRNDGPRLLRSHAQDLVMRKRLPQRIDPRGFRQSLLRQSYDQFAGDPGGGRALDADATLRLEDLARVDRGAVLALKTEHELPGGGRRGGRGWRRLLPLRRAGGAGWRLDGWGLLSR